MHTAVFGCVIVHGAGHADSCGAGDEYQCDHRYGKGQFHGTPPGFRMETNERDKRYEAGQLERMVRLHQIRVNLPFLRFDWSLGH